MKKKAAPHFFVHSTLYLALFGGLLFGLSRQQDAIEGIRGVSLDQCDRTNLIRGFLRQDASKNARAPQARRALADRLFPLLDCPVVVATGVQDRIASALETRFIAAVSRGQHPLVRRGRVLVPRRP